MGWKGKYGLMSVVRQTESERIVGQACSSPKMRDGFPLWNHPQNVYVGYSHWVHVVLCRVDT